jgi:hypothetical protein
MALESAETVSKTIVRFQNKLSSDFAFQELGESYVVEYSRKFSSRLRLCSLLRRAAFSPVLAESVIALCNASAGIKTLLAKGTRGAGGRDSKIKGLSQKSAPVP